MRLADLLGMAISALYQQRVRTLLTMFGVLIGTFTLVMSISVGRGVYETTMRQIRRGNQLRQIEVSPGYGALEAEIPRAVLEVKGQMSAVKRERIRKVIVREWTRNHPQLPKVPLTRSRLQMLASLEHVETVLPFIQRTCRVALEQAKAQTVLIGAADTDDSHLRNRIVAGTYFSSDHEPSVIVHEYLLYLWGITRDDDVRGVLGKKLRLEYRTGRPPAPSLLSFLQAGRFSLTPEEKQLLDKAVKHLPAARQKLDLTPSEMDALTKMLHRLPAQSNPRRPLSYGEEFTITGVIRESVKGDELPGIGLSRFGWESEVFLPVRTAENFFWRRPPSADQQVQWATITVDHEDNLKEVVHQIEGMGLRQWSLSLFVDRVRTNLVLMTFVMTLLALVALLVSALGITNTMLMSVLERTHEIGVMKAVGARDRHIHLMFLVEGALIGAIGGGLGLLLSWVASFPGDAIGKALMEKQTGRLLQETLFLFPPWLTLGAPLFAMLVTTLAALYPARRAARVSPITALRHE